LKTRTSKRLSAKAKQDVGDESYKLT